MSPIDPRSPDAGGWTPDVCDNWAPPEQLTPAEWAEKYRTLSRRQSPSRPGPWLNANQPALVGIMVLAVYAGVRELWIKKSAQFGGSEAIRCIIGWLADLYPCPVLLVLPNEKKGREDIRKKIIPLFHDTKRLKRHLSVRKLDNKLNAITLTNGFELTLGYAGSTTSIAGDPQAVVVLDEVDKFENLSQQADPVAEARVRLRTVRGQGKGLLVANSTPSTGNGPIAVGYAKCTIKLYFFLHCPHCGEPFRPTFDQLTWEKFADLLSAEERAERIKARNAAWIQCPHCAARELVASVYPESKRIVDRHKRRMIQDGFWATEDRTWRIYCDGHAEGIKPEGERIGLQINALFDLSVSFSDVAAEFVACDGQYDRLKDFYNLTLGEEFKDVAADVIVSVFSAKCRPNEDLGFIPPLAKTIPPWASKLLMTVDTQKTHFWFVVRAWGANFRSQRVHHGRATSFEEIEDLYYRAAWHYENDCYPPLTCFGQAPLAIDSGGGMDRTETDASITDRVYQWCLKDPTWRFPIKGASKPFDGHVRWKDLTYQDPTKKRAPYSVRLHFIDPIQSRDLLMSYVTLRQQVVNPQTGEVDPDHEIDQWLLNDCDDEEYNRHLAVMAKSRIKSGRGFIEKYGPKTPGARHDYHDLESYQIAWALYGPGKCFALPTPKQLIAMYARSQQPAPARSTGIRMPDGRPFFATQRK
jgi:phage terminase large subunit GpA-like protein